jgi:hypothetical protein
MDLAALTTLAELNYVSGAIDILNKDTEALYAIGATDQLNEGVWKWTTGEPWTAENEQMWVSQEPNGGTSENCGRLSSTSWLFRSESCGNGAPTLCESTEPIN